MAAYAALVSLNFLIDQVPHSLLPDKNQIQSLKNKIQFLEKFLEDYSQGSSKELSFQALEIEIRDVSNAAEDMIESYVLDKTVLKPAGVKKTKRSTLLFHEHIQKAMKELESINEKAMKIKDAAKGQQPQSSSPPGGAARSAPRSEDNSMVGFDEHLVEIMDLITSDESDLRILPIVGMPGIGKTTLIRNVFDNQLIKDHFRICIWSTISQTYNLQEIYLSFLHDVGIVDQQDLDPNELGLKLYKSLSATRYLVILDDVWSGEVWDKLKTFFPDNGEGNRVIITTRLLSVASYIGSYDPYELEFLNKDESWNLLKQKVFAADECPSTLEDVGKDIAVSCRGLPLAIVVIAGQLVKSNMTRKSWEYVAGALSSLVNSGDDDHCLKILSLSYDNLPVYLKPCFLYMGAFPEDSEVRVSTLVKLWVAEGFLKTIGDKSQEECAMEYLKDLFERHLILVSKRASSGNFKTIRIHDLLRDLCLREAHKQNLLCVKRFHSFHVPHDLHILPGSNCIYRTISEYMSHNSLSLNPIRSASLELSSLKLLSELNVADENSPQKNLLLIGSRCLTLSAQDVSISLASLSKLWSLQSLVMKEMLGNKPIVLPRQIWEMSQLRHLEIPKALLSTPPKAKLFIRKAHVLENLQTLQDVQNFNITSQVLQRIPNIKKLKLTYTEDYRGAWWPFFSSHCCVHLAELCKLESLSLLLHIKISMAHLSFPQSLKKLTLDGGEIPWKDITMVGQLPNLVVLRLCNNAFSGTEWRVAEGEFCKLKSLHLQNISLENWETDSSRFLKLESLIFDDVWRLKEIPPSFEDSGTLQSVSFEFCSTSLVNSAKLIKAEQERMGNTSIQVKEHLTCDRKDQLVMKLEDDLHKLKAILANLIKDKQHELARPIQQLIVDAEDISDTYLAQQLVLNNPLRFRKLFRLNSVNYIYKLYEIAKDIGFQLDQSKLDSTHLNALDEDPQRKEHEMMSQHIVGLEAETKLFVDQLTGESDILEISSIVGMAGLGKTTLAWKIFEHSVLKYEFPVRIWVNITYELNMRNVLLTILRKLTGKAPWPEESEQKLITKVREHLKVQKFLIVMDDIWTNVAWIALRRILPMDNKMGRVLVTTRHMDVSRHASSMDRIHYLRFRTHDENWELLQYEVYGKLHVVPHKLMDTGKVIATDCVGVPLLTVVIGGILVEIISRAGKNISQVLKEWKEVSMSMKRCLVNGSRIILLSHIIELNYENLPYRLRNCFLYLGVFPEDADIPVSRLIRLWVAEGLIIGSRNNLSLEQIALEILKDLISRNLIRVRKASLDGKPKICYIHDSVREIIKTHAAFRNLNFFEEIMQSQSQISNNIDKCRRICVHSYVPDFFKTKPKIQKARSFLCFHDSAINLKMADISVVTDAFGLLRVYHAENIRFPRFPRKLLELLHLRYLTLVIDQVQSLPEIISELWNLQTLMVDIPSHTLQMKVDIWKMTQLRHFKTKASIDLRRDGKGDGGENLQTLSRLSPESCTDEVFRKARNLVTLGIQGYLNSIASLGCFEILDRLDKLKLVHKGTDGSAATTPMRRLPDPQSFPPNLKILVLCSTYLDWSKMEVLSRLGSLEAVKLKGNAFRGEHWEADYVGGFPHLERLHIERSTELVHWKATGDPFPKLKFLALNNCEKLIEVPYALGNSLEVLSLELVTTAAVMCAKEIVEEQMKLEREVKLDIA